MVRMIFSWMLVSFSSLFLALSAAGIFAVWAYNEPLTREALSRLEDIDRELAQAESALQATRAELERALRVLDAAQMALEKLTAQSVSADSLLEGIQSALDERLLPELRNTRERLGDAREVLEGLRALLQSVDALPFLNLDLHFPDQVLIDLIASAETLDSEIASAEELAQRASMFVGDTSYLLGGDLGETRASLEGFLQQVEEYQLRVAGWRELVLSVRQALPSWVDRASLTLTLFLLWFGFSQFSLLLHGQAILRGENPLDGWRVWKRVRGETVREG
jgi:chromosome segregation ATPase